MSAHSLTPLVVWKLLGGQPSPAVEPDLFRREDKASQPTRDARKGKQQPDGMLLHASSFNIERDEFEPWVRVVMALGFRDLAGWPQRLY